MRTNRAVIVQCRLSSTRLPGKALKLLDEKPVLEWVLHTMHKVNADKYFVATDVDSFEQLQQICEANKFQCFAGPLDDVLERFCMLIRENGVKTIIRATADNPFLFYEAAEDSVEQFEKLNKKGKCDYFTYSGLPHGSGVEVFSGESLLKAASETDNPYDHEHVGPALYNHKDKYNCVFEKAPYKYNFPELRTTIDTYTDFLRASLITQYLGKKDEPYTCEEIISACNSNFVKNPVVLVPSVVKGHGTGHLHRCLSIACSKKYFVYIPQNSTLEEKDSLIEQYKEKGLKQNQIITQLPDENYQPVIITDTFEITKSQLNEFANSKTLISIDEGSQYLDNCDYLLDIIPSINLNRKVNCTDSSLIQKPEFIRSEKSKVFSKVLICLGGEDPANLTLPCVNAVKKLLPQAKITAIKTKKITEEQNIENVDFVSPIPDLREKLHTFDLVLTHYGLTAFEAAYAGCAIILLPTTNLHKQLAEKYNFSYIKEKITEQSLKKALEDEKIYPQLSISSENNSLDDFVEKLSNGEKNLCPVCGLSNYTPDQIVSRNATRTYRRCQNCGIVYMSFSTETKKEYKKAYFFEDYKKQYGKTYQEDFESIKKQCFKRLEAIKLIKPKMEQTNVLDIGCAYGPFLSAAADMKLIPYGTDISEDAVSYVQNELHYPASVCAFPEIDVTSEFGIHQFDIVTMWYVIEHFKNLDGVLRKVNQILKKDGIFAFSTPSGEGVSAKTDKEHFYKISPTDHYTIWEPSKANKILKKYGFQIVKTVSTGHHPERFPKIKETNSQPGSLQWELVEKMSRIKKLGDTVEIYCKKIF